MKHQLLRFSLPRDKHYYASEFREDLAKSNALPPEFFCYDPDTQRPIRQGKAKESRFIENGQERVVKIIDRVIPSIRTVAGRGWVGILADQDSVDLLERAVVPAMKAVKSRFNCSVPMQMEEHDLRISETNEVRPYFVREMVVKKGGRAGMDDHEISALVTRRLTKAIATQADAYNLDCPVYSQMGIVVAELNRPRGLRLVTNTGTTNQYAMLVDVKFYTHLNLIGFWFAGNLTSRGYGRIGLNLGEFGLKQAGETIR